MSGMNARSPITVAIARFEDLVAHGLRALIAEDPNIEVVLRDVPHERLPVLVAQRDPLVAIVNFGSLRSPVELRDLHLLCPQTRFVVLANRPTPDECNQMLTFGATACLSKETQARDILNAIHLASRGMHVLPRTPRELDLARAPGPDLVTPREADVLELLLQGRSNSEIARTLSVGVETVRTHARHVYRKLGVRDRRELVRRHGTSSSPEAPPMAPVAS